METGNIAEKLAKQLLFWLAVVVSIQVVIEPILIIFSDMKPSASYRVGLVVCASVHWIAYFLVRERPKYPGHTAAFLCLSLFIFIGLYNPYDFNEMWIVFLFYPIILSLFADKKLFFLWSAGFFLTFGLFIAAEDATRSLEIAEIVNRCTIAAGSFTLALIILTYNVNLINTNRSASEEKNREYVISLLHTLIPIVERKSQSTSKEIDLMSKLIKRMLREFPEEKVADWEIKLISLLHYVSRINWPDYVFEKEEKLTSYEYQIIQEHCFIGRDLLNGHPAFERVLEVLQHHHERLDGSGYPDQLNGETIPILAQIVGVVESYSAMTMPRPYRRALTFEEACEEIRSMAGVAFEEKVVRALLQSLRFQPQTRSVEEMPPVGRMKSS